VAAVSASYYTDPASPWSWAIEPVVRKLEVVFGPSLHFEYIMGGLAREFGSPSAIVGEWLDAAAWSGMPVDPRLWLADPPRSSYPACLAVKAAGDQGEQPAEAYLRLLREGFACEGNKLAGPDALVAAARGVPALDAQRFRIDLESHATLERFGADLERAEAVPEDGRGPEGGRARLPSIEFTGENGAVHGVYGHHAYEAYRDAALAAGAEPVDQPAPTVEEALRRFGTLATAEVVAICELPGPRAAAELWRLAADWKVRGERRLGGELWRLA
jgi:predicted DsbA family dithiol-disulfide isomerase